MARERYNASIKCSNCGQEGILRVSENDYAFMRRLDRNVKVTDGSFEAIMANDSDATVKCLECNNKFIW